MRRRRALAAPVVERVPRPALRCRQSFHDVANGDMSTRPLLSPEYCGAPAHRVNYLLQPGQPGGKKVLARSKRLQRFFIVVKRSPYGRDS